MKKIPENMSVIFKAVSPFVIIVILFLVLGQIGIGKITKIRADISKARSNQLILTQKLDMLRTVAVNGAADSNIVTNALPDSNPSLVVISQLRELADTNGLSLSSIKSTSVSSTGDFSSAEITFDVSGDKNVLATFLSGINKFAPISVLNGVKITQVPAGLSAEVSVKSYWAPLPTKLPASIEEFSDLTADDKQILTNISNLTQPKFVSLPPATQAGRADPFAQ